MLVMLVMLLVLLLLLLQGTGWLLLAMADSPIGRTTANCMLASVAATKLLRQLEELSGCSISSSGMQSRKLSSSLPWSVWGCAIAGCIPVEWILQQIMEWILTMFLARTPGNAELTYVLRLRNTSVHTLLTVSSMFLVSHLLCALPPGSNSGGALNLPVFQANSQWWMAIMVRAMNVGLVESINNVSCRQICCTPWKYVQWIRSTISVAANRNLHF